MKTGAGPREGIWRDRLRHLFWAALSAGLLCLAFHPVDQPLFAWCAFVPWMVFHARAPRRGTVFALGVATFGYHLYRIWWVSEIALPPVFVIPLFGVPTTLLTAWLVDRAVHRWGASMLWVYPLLFVGGDWLLETMIGTAWAGVGYSQWRWMEGLQLASIFRVHGLSAVVLLANATLATLVLVLLKQRSKRQGFRAVGACLLVLACTQAIGVYRLRETGTKGPRALGVQPNISVGDKNRRLTAEEMWWRVHEAVRAAERTGDSPDLFVAPETSFPVLWLEPGAARVTDHLRRFFPPRLAGRERVLWDEILPDRPGSVSVLGVLRKIPIAPGSGEPDDYGDGWTEENVALILQGRQKEVGAYAKRILVPLGETVPGRGWMPFRETLLAMISENFGLKPEMRAGTEQPVFAMETDRGAWQFAVSICYEIVFAADYREPFEVSVPPDFLVNISNDGWYGRSSELDQVHVMTRFRAVETGRSIFRVSNTGISTLIDGRGRELATVESPAGERKEVAGVLEAQIPVFDGLTAWVWGGEGLAALPGLIGLIGALLCGVRAFFDARECRESS